MMLKAIQEQAAQAIREILDAAHLSAGDLLIVGCSSSEVCGGKIGKNSSPEVAQAIFDGIAPQLSEHGIYLAAQCCEHLNRAVILEAEAAAAYRLPQVNVVPQPKAGGSFATVAYHAFSHPVAVESLCHQAAAGIDIGGTLIGMHLRPVAVPLRLSFQEIGAAHFLCARTRPKFVGGSRAVYDETLL